jgi:phosphoglycolate phosphatase
LKIIMDVEAAFLDFNGTIINDKEAAFETSLEMISLLGNGKCTRDLMASKVLLPQFCWKEFYREFGVHDTQKETKRVFHELYRARLGQIRLFPGVKRTLECLHRKGIRLAIVTLFREDVVLECLDRYGISGYFEDLVRADKGGMDFDKFAEFRDLLELMRIPPERVAAVGDMPLELRAANQLGMRKIGFLGGMGTEDVLTKAGAETCIRRFSELAKILRRPRE